MRLSDFEKTRLWKLQYDYEHIGLTQAEYIEMKNLERKKGRN